MSKPEIVFRYEQEPQNRSCQPNERIIKVDVAIPENFCKPVEYTTIVEAELTTPVMLDTTQDKHRAFN